MNQYSCKDCGTELTALNMSDDEKYCKACFDKTVAGMDTEDESPETKQMPEWAMDEIITSPCPQSHELYLQRMRGFRRH